MPLTFKARVLLELGAELISSDAIAIYELVKNSVDAKSKQVEIQVTVAMQPSALSTLLSILEASELPGSVWDPNRFASVVESSVEPSAPPATVEKFLEIFGSPASPADAKVALKEASFACNSVVLADKGVGMTRKQLDEHYLTVGTPVRLFERLQSSIDPAESSSAPLGEKGIGRLAAMRLGKHVQVETGVKGKQYRSKLTLDWRRVFSDPNLDADELDFPIIRGSRKKATSQGTVITIRELQSDWSLEKLEDLSQTDLAKLRDPFQNSFSNLFLKIHFQGDQHRDLIEPFPRELLAHCDGVCDIEYDNGQDDDKPRLHITSDYRIHEKTEHLVHESAHLEAIVSSHPTKTKKTGKDAVKNDEVNHTNSDATRRALISLGSFKAKFWWFNRGRLMRSEETKELWNDSLKAFIDSWGGGLLVYRDQFRVYPYGSHADDWLGLDRKAFGSGGYKLNRSQIIGYLRISSTTNPHLQDQTNREGFRDCPEKIILSRLLQKSISEFKRFTTNVDREKTIDVDEETLTGIDKRISSSKVNASKDLRRLRKRVPHESTTIDSILERLEEVEDAWSRAKQTLSIQRDEVEDFLELAGVGMMVEVIAHELTNLTANALGILGSGQLTPGYAENLKAQLDTINKRFRVIDELSAPGRQRKTIQDIPRLIEMTKEAYLPKMERHGISMNIRLIKSSKSFHAKVQKGMFVQIVDNIIRNSVYWLSRRANRKHEPTIDVTINPKNGTIEFRDNGPGIPQTTGDIVFQRRYTTKPRKEGRGMGLYIAKKFAAENKIVLGLLPSQNGVHPGFVLEFDL